MKTRKKLKFSPNMTLNQWVDSGGNMLSAIVTRRCCKYLDINERALREMKLSDICNLAEGGEPARREIERFRKENQ
jgi:hypothetical protein